MSTVVAFPQVVLDTVTELPEYTERRRAADAAYAAYQDALQSRGLFGDPGTVHDAWQRFTAAQAEVTELYDMAFRAHATGMLR